MGWHTLMPKNADKPLARALVEQGPVAISVAADSWFEYAGGIFDGCDKNVIVNHAVTLYGYGEQGAHKYWLIRNTWGPTWGEEGFLRMKRHDEGETYCGLDSNYQEGVGCKDDPKTIEVCGMCGMYSDSVVPHFGGAKNLSRPGVPDWLLAREASKSLLAANVEETATIGVDAGARMMRAGN
jgi:cathepsin L